MNIRKSIFGSPFLKMYDTYTAFQSVGMSPESKDIWNNLVIKGAITKLICFKRMAFTRSGPHTLWMLV